MALKQAEGGAGFYSKDPFVWTEVRLKRTLRESANSPLRAFSPQIVH